MVLRPDHLEATSGDRVLQLDGSDPSVAWCSASSAPGCPPTWSTHHADDLVDASLHQLLAARLDRQVAGGLNQIRAVAATAQLAERIDVPAGSPLLLLEGCSVGGDGDRRWRSSRPGTEATWPPSTSTPCLLRCGSAPPDRDRVDRLAQTMRDALAELLEELRG